MNPAAPSPVLGGDEVRLLTEIGFVAIGRSDPDRARQLFTALCELRPDSAFAYLGLAMALMSGGRALEAVRLLLQVISRFPKDAQAQTQLGMALRLCNRHAQSTAVLTQLVRRRDIGEQEKRLARALLSEPATQTESH